MIRESYLVGTTKKYPGFSNQLATAKTIIAKDFYVEVYYEGKDISGVAVWGHLPAELAMHVIKYHHLQSRDIGMRTFPPLICTEEDKLKPTLDAAVEKTRSIYEICRAAVIKAIHGYSENGRLTFLDGEPLIEVYPIEMTENAETLRSLIPLVAKDKKDATKLTSQLEWSGLPGTAKVPKGRHSLREIISQLWKN